MTFCYIDTETLGLSLAHHDIWEIAYAFDSESVQSSFVTHSLISAEPVALALNNYYGREGHEVDALAALNFEKALLRRLSEQMPGAVIVGANPEFDKYRLSRRWGGAEPWSHRSIDVRVYAAAALGWEVPEGLYNTAAALAEMGYEVPQPTHAAAEDVASVRAVHLAALDLLSRQRASMDRDGQGGA